ncbi:MAG: hypothetical protein PUC12_06970 [Clostridiales bacterium]|nr:hypothetical protein [Clostridiales bacterium]
MKKVGNIVYIGICLILCVLPFAGMTVYRTNITTENKTLAAFPNRKKDGKLNQKYFSDLSAYFEDHFAFRQELVSADAIIQSKVFGVSNVDTIMVGTDGWLFYTDTVDDYLKQNTMTERQVFNTVHNLSLLQQYVTGQGAEFLFTVAPNKNSLYDDNMPYYTNYKSSSKKNMDMLKPKLKEAGISYVDLFEAFEKEQEILYLKRDSHWNNKGAVLAYNTILDNLMITHETYETVKTIREKKEYGDLNKMLYPLNAKPEWNYYYQYDSHWSYVSKEQNVEAAWIETECPKGEGTLLMFRDSFGNTLLPLLAEQFSNASFSKAVPYRIAEYMEKCRPNLVLVEKVERNLDEYMQSPPVMPGPEVRLNSIEENDRKEDITLVMSEAIEDTDYWTFSGELKQNNIEADAKIYVRLNDGEKSKTYEAFTTSTEESDYGYLLYLSKNELQSLGFLSDRKITIDIITGEGNYYKLLNTKEIFLKENQ